MKIETYMCCACSTGHLTKHDCDILHAMTVASGMVLERDTGYFVKLYEDLSDNLSSRYSESLNELITAAHKAGYRMIEFDRDAEPVPGYRVYDR